MNILTLLCIYHQQPCSNHYTTLSGLNPLPISCCKKTDFFFFFKQCKSNHDTQLPNSFPYVSLFWDKNSEFHLELTPTQVSSFFLFPTDSPLPDHLLSQEAATMIFFQFLYACRHLKFLCLQPETLPLLLVCLFSSYLCISLDNHFCCWIDILSQAFFLEFRVFQHNNWRRKWQLTPVFLPGESQGQRSLEAYRLWGCAESDTTEATQQQQGNN